MVFSVIKTLSFRTQICTGVIQYSKSSNASLDLKFEVSKVLSCLTVVHGYDKYDLLTKRQSGSQVAKLHTTFLLWQPNLFASNTRRHRHKSKPSLLKHVHDDDKATSDQMMPTHGTHKVRFL
jgi:hypothetical protein